MDTADTESNPTRSPETTFQMIDADGSGRVDKSEFAVGLELCGNVTSCSTHSPPLPHAYSGHFARGAGVADWHAQGWMWARKTWTWCGIFSTMMVGGTWTWRRCAPSCKVFIKTLPSMRRSRWDVFLPVRSSDIVFDPDCETFKLTKKIENQLF